MTSVDQRPNTRLTDEAPLPYPHYSQDRYEGVDVPAADLAIVLASSRSRRQMVQRMGRVVRKKKDGRLARLVVMYVMDSSEDPEVVHEDFLYLVTKVSRDIVYFGPKATPRQITDYLNDWRP